MQIEVSHASSSLKESNEGGERQKGSGEVAVESKRERVVDAVGFIWHPHF